MRPDDLALLRQPSSPTLRGDLLVVAVARPDADANEYHSALQRIPLAGGAARPWTWGAKDGSPRLSPDGRWLAFTSTRTGRRACVLAGPSLDHVGSRVPLRA